MNRFLNIDSLKKTLLNEMKQIILNSMDESDELIENCSIADVKKLVDKKTLNVIVEVIKQCKVLEIRHNIPSKEINIFVENFPKTMLKENRIEINCITDDVSIITFNTKEK